MLEEEGRFKFVLKYHEKGLRKNKQCKKIDPSCMKLINEKGGKKKKKTYKFVHPGSTLTTLLRAS